MEFGVVASLFVKHTGLSPDRTFCVFVWGLMTKPTRWRLFSFFFGDASCDMNSVHPSSLTAPFKSTCKHLRGWWHDAVSESAVSSVFCFFLFSTCYSVLFFGIVVTEWFHFMPNDWTFTLLFHFRSGCVWRKMHHLFFPWSFLHLVSNLALAWHFSFLSNAAGFVSFFLFVFCFLSQTLTSPLWVKNRHSYEGFEDIPAVWLQEAAFMKNTFVADWGVCLWFLFSKHVHRSKLMQQVVIFDDLKKKRKQQQQNSCFPIGQSALCKNGRYILTDQLYLSVCPMIVATMWTVYSGFCIVALPEHHLLYVCDVFLPFCCVFFGVVLMSSPLPRAPGSRGK